MSHKKDWETIFTSSPKKESELPLDYYSRIGKKIGIKPISVKCQYFRWKNKIDVEAVKVTPDFTTFSKDYVMPDGIDESHPDFILDCKKVLIISDIHFPFHDRQALMTALEQGESCDVILLNGDVMDCYSESRFMKNPKHRMLHDELNLVRDFLEYLRSRFKKKRILFKLGNHELRHQHYIFKNADALSGLPDLEISNLLKFAQYGIEEVKQSQLIRSGSLNILHGHEYRGGAGTINISRQMLLKTFDNIIIGHFHQTNSYTVRKVNQDIIGAWATGCLCKLRPEYATFNHWTHGFATVEFDGKFFNVENRKIINGKLF